jgi:hypothetical protein
MMLEKSKRKSGYSLRWALTIGGVILICVSAIHRTQLGNTAAYTTSPLVGIEIILMLTLLFPFSVVPGTLFGVYLEPMVR